MKKFQLKNFVFWKFSTIKINTKQFEASKFIKFNQKKSPKIFDREILTDNMTYNIIYFSSKYREMSNISKFIRPLLITLNSKFKTISKSWSNYYFSKYYFLSWLKKKLFYNKFSKILSENFNINLYNITFVNKIFNSSTVQSDDEKFSFKNKNVGSITKDENLIKKSPIKAFLYVRSTRNNFFVTVIDNNGWTLITRSGGMGEWTASRQRASVFSADSAVYEACYLAKKWGIEALNIHVRSTFWLPQIRNSFEGLEASGLEINELLYRPKMSFGGCRKKRPRRV